MELTNAHHVPYAGLQPKPDTKYGKNGQQLVYLGKQGICFTASIFAKLTIVNFVWTSSVPTYIQNVQKYRRCHLWLCTVHCAESLIRHTN